MVYFSYAEIYYKDIDMFDNLFNKNVYKYVGEIGLIEFIDESLFFASVHQIYNPLCYLTEIELRTNARLFGNDSMCDFKYYKGYVYYSYIHTHLCSKIIYRYNVILKSHEEFIVLENGSDFQIKDDRFFVRTSLTEIEEFSLSGEKLDSRVRDLSKSKGHQIMDFKVFKDDCIIQDNFDFQFKGAYIKLAGDGFDSTTFTAQKYDCFGDYLIISTTYFTKHNVDPKIKVFTLNSAEDEWVLVSELKYDVGIFSLKIVNDFIYVLDCQNNILILDLNCNIIRKIGISEEVLCFDVNTNNTKLAYSYHCFGSYVKVIDI